MLTTGFKDVVSEGPWILTSILTGFGYAMTAEEQLRGKSWKDQNCSIQQKEKRIKFWGHGGRKEFGRIAGRRKEPPR